MCEPKADAGDVGHLTNKWNCLLVTLYAFNLHFHCLIMFFFVELFFAMIEDLSP